MIKKFAVIKNETVINTILLDTLNFESYSAAAGLTADTLIELDDNSQVAIGWSYLEDNFVNELNSGQNIENDDDFVPQLVLKSTKNEV